ncbi:hypothetical protein GCM10009102_31650 [Sphingomonas insulae]|uniref:DUF4139 domain-containing protein n=2 Tax=Sphingomonas insulae TaxID=424800 RepID=A0ABP3T4L2_9SPHN
MRLLALGGMLASTAAGAQVQGPAKAQAHALAAAQAPAPGGPVTVISAGPRTVAVTVYRNPARGRYEAMDLRWLQGFALVTETRTVRLPKGRAVLRFEGVAEGIVPVSAIIDGLPGGTIEKNRDARLLSPASLVDGTLGRGVTLTRTDPATGKRHSEAATIVAGAAQGVVVKTAAGIEALRCAGLPETLGFGGVPTGLSAKPVLSVATDTPSTRTVTVTMSYLTAGFDWSASYVATVAADPGGGGETLDLFAWLTLANGNPQAFVHADVKAVAGRLNRTATEGWMRAAGDLALRCYPLGTTTSDLPEIALPEAAEADDANDIVVTGMRMMGPPPPPPPAPAPAPAMMAPPPEDLGDLKLYTVPAAVTVAPRGQKQVALLAAGRVPFERRYRRSIVAGETLEGATTGIVLVMRNRREDRLGLPLPAGTTALYADRGGSGRLLLGTGTIGDRATGQVVRIAAGTSAQVSVDQQAITVGARDGRTGGGSGGGSGGDGGRARVTVRNANPFAVEVELPIGRAGQDIKGQATAGQGGKAQAVDAMAGTLAEVDGIATWRVRLGAGATASLDYRYR